jgi:hypothetical protein
MKKDDWDTQALCSRLIESRGGDPATGTVHDENQSILLQVRAKALKSRARLSEKRSFRASTSGDTSRTEARSSSRRTRVSSRSPSRTGSPHEKRSRTTSGSEESSA